MDPNYAPKSDQTSVTYSVWYLYRPGTLQSHNELPKNSQINSKTKFNWLIPVGTKLHFKGSNFNHFVLNVEITHDNRKIVDKDLEYFMNVWRPDIV